MLTALNRLGETPWFGLGDQDLATHLIRTHLLREGWRLTDVAQRLNRSLGVEYPLLPVTDDPVATIVDTVEHGELGFQTYFVRYRWQPTVRALRYEGIADAKMTPEVRTALENADAVMIGPSNPWLSIQPILDVPGVREILQNRAIPRIAVTPIIGGEAVKGPAAKIMRELGLDVSAESVARHYADGVNRDMINGFVDDEVNPNFELDSVKIEKFNTLMVTNQDKINLAYKLLESVEDWN
jgi:LPPG:FO 2-phospho-L-lactate transferase